MEDTEVKDLDYYCYTKVIVINYIDFSFNCNYTMVTITNYMGNFGFNCIMVTSQQLLVNYYCFHNMVHCYYNLLQHNCHLFF